MWRRMLTGLAGLALAGCAANQVSARPNPGPAIDTAARAIYWARLAGAEANADNVLRSAEEKLGKARKLADKAPVRAVRLATESKADARLAKAMAEAFRIKTATQRVEADIQHLGRGLHSNGQE